MTLSSAVSFLAAGAIAACAWAQTPSPEKPSAAGVEFFESKIRPVLAKNCYPCHSGATKVAMGGLFLDSRNGITKGGAGGAAVVPGQPDQSPLIRALRYDGRKMPPSAQLPAGVIADFEKWVEMGAPDPRETQAADWKPAAIDIDKGRKYWAFQPVQKPTTPKVKNTKWSSEAIDRFLLARMEEKRVTPVADADRATWLRRVSFDLSGLPPTPEEIDAFQKDRGKDAYAKVVDRLLASERYGERWGRHWLDVARYAETVGRGRNYIMPFAWRYRNYVIDSFNRDKPYDQFVKEQIAGDLLPSTSAKQRNEQMTGAGFLSLGSNDLIEINPQVFRMDVVDEMINATSRSFLGLTVGCARCHDHKFDPIPTTDYYAMAGIFKSTEILSGLQRRPRDNASYFNMDLLARINYEPGEPRAEHIKDPEQLKKWEALRAQLSDMLNGKRKGTATAKLRVETRGILLELDKYPLPPDLMMSARDNKEIADCEVNIRGDVQNLGPKVPRGFVQVAGKAGEKAQIGPGESGRLELAEWIARRDNPLTARVMVNRIWHHMFGRGIVPTLDNFGKMGEQPSNQPLLDYMAARFMDQGWSIKKMVREIALSRAYRMSAVQDARNAKIDPDNVLLWRMNRRRLEVEAIRDSLLAVSGQLDLNPPAASPVLHMSRGFDLGRGRNNAPDDYSVKMKYRSVYVPVMRNFIPPMFEVFDFPEPSETKGMREVTTVPTQALFLMNNTFVIDQSKHAAEKLLAAGALTDEARVTRVYREVLGRLPTADEVQKSLEFMKFSSAASDTGADPATAGQTAWGRLYQALFASAEFRYRS
ncbi:MAG TPA: PSD1 and planctomycete cytochrome C domain-containing protein [Bryobacteraceae bacterium]|nr:PSD1 and planctomycete cytochrome C domain-containing protein [Bryobacteraceae bacterium]